MAGILLKRDEMKFNLNAAHCLKPNPKQNSGMTTDSDSLLNVRCQNISPL